MPRPCHLSAYADGLEVLAKHGVAEMVEECGRRVRARWKEKTDGD